MTNNGAMEPTPEVLRQWAQALVVSAHARWKETLRGIDYDAQVAANENAVRMETIKDWLLAEATRREAEAGEKYGIEELLTISDERWREIERLKERIARLEAAGDALSEHCHDVLRGTCFKCCSGGLILKNWTRAKQSVEGKE